MTPKTAEASKFKKAYGEMGYLKSVGTAIVYISLSLAVITFIPGLPPETEFVEYRYYDTIEKKTKFI